MSVLLDDSLRAWFDIFDALLLVIVAVIFYQHSIWVIQHETKKI